MYIPFQSTHIMSLCVTIYILVRVILVVFEIELIVNPFGVVQFVNDREGE